MLKILASLPANASATTKLLLEFPWHQTSLGAVEVWTPVMKTTVALMMQSPLPIVTLWGPDGYMVYNDAYSVFAGGRHPGLLGSKVREGWPEIADFNDNVMHVCLAGGALSYTDQELTLHRTGAPEQVFMNLDYSPILAGDGAIEGVIAFVVETTDKVKAERALRESELQFRTFAQAMPHHVWTAPADGKLDWCNDRVYEYTGKSIGALHGDGWDIVVHPEDIADAAAKWATAISSGQPYETQFRIRGHDGGYRWFLARAYPMRDDHGVITRWIGSSTDIHEQKQTSEALAKINASLEEQVSERTAERDRMWKLSKDIMLVADFNAVISNVSPAFTTILGWHTSEVVGCSFMDLVHPEDMESTLRQVSTLSSGTHVFRFENRYRRKDGSYCSLSWTASPGDNFIHAVGRDITADLHRAEEIKQTQVALQQAQKMETIGKLTGGVAHDFNNLLQVISGNLQLIGSHVHDRPELRKRVDNALAGVDRGAKLAGHLLAFARRQPLEPKVVKVGRLITGMEDMLRRALGEEVEVETVISGGLWSTSIDINQVENAILNLAINARDAMEGRGKLTVEVNNAHLDSTYCATHVDVAPGQYVMIAVSDTGSGMTADVMSQAFEPFFSTKPEGKGTGLGLSMVYGFVKQSGGHIKIYSEINEGTTVKLYLPRSREAEDVYTALASLPVQGGSETVLVAEDDDAVRATVVDMLSELGYKVLRATDAASARTVIDSGIHVDLLFTDVVMPGPLRSPELAKKAKERLPNLAVLFTSGYTENAIVHGGRLDAGVELIGKPYSKESLARKIRHVLANETHKSKQREAPVAPMDIKPDSPSAGSQAAKYKIILVEDDEAILENTCELLRYLGHEVVAALNAEQALPHLDESIDLVITDQELPGMKGDELLAIAQKSVPHAKLVIASGYGTSVSVNRGISILTKPYGVDELNAICTSLTALPK